MNTFSRLLIVVLVALSLMAQQPNQIRAGGTEKLSYETLDAVCKSARQSREIWGWNFNAAFMERLVWALEFKDNRNLTPTFVRGLAADPIPSPSLYWTYEPWTTERSTFQVIAYADAGGEGYLLPGTLMAVFYVKKTTTAPAGGWYLPLERTLTSEEVSSCQFPTKTASLTRTYLPVFINR